MRWLDLLGFAAATAVLAGFCLHEFHPTSSGAGSLKQCSLRSLRLVGAHLSSLSPPYYSVTYQFAEAQPH